jgi:His-Xaa-Ser system protein HxsD
MQQRITVSATMATVSFSKEVFDHEAVLGAAYHLTDKYGVEVGVEDKDFIAMLIPKENYSPTAAAMREDLLSFCNDVLDEELRLKLQQKTARLLDVIVRHAFSPIDLRKELGNS